MKKIIILGICFAFLLNYCFSYSKNHDMEEVSRVRYAYKDIPGYVYFEGFDFEGYSSESAGIEPMLEVTLKLLEDKYGNTNQPFVFVGHSQGGLRALAMSTYLRQKNPKNIYRIKF